MTSLDFRLIDHVLNAARRHRRAHDSPRPDRSDDRIAAAWLETGQ
jgi:hypothetical protein